MPQSTMEKILLRHITEIQNKISILEDALEIARKKQKDSVRRKELINSRTPLKAGAER